MLNRHVHQEIQQEAAAAAEEEEYYYEQDAEEEKAYYSNRGREEENSQTASEDYPYTSSNRYPLNTPASRQSQQQQQGKVPQSEMSVSELQRLLNNSNLNLNLNNNHNAGYYPNSSVPPSPNPLTGSVRFQPMVPHDSHLEYTRQLLNNSQSTTSLGATAGFLHYHDGSAKQHQYYGNEGIITRLCIAQGPLVKVSRKLMRFCVVRFT